MTDAEAGLTASVVIATHSADRLGLLLRCVRSLAAGRTRPKETIVVVDSNPALQAELTETLAEQAVVLANEGTGASDARNTAFAKAKGDVVACLDDDADPEAAWLESLLSTFEKRPVVGVGGRVVPEYEDGARALPAEFLWVVGCTYKGHPTEEGPITRPIGANMAFRSYALSSVGGFSSSFGPRAKGDVDTAPRVGLKTRLLREGGREAGSNEELALALALRQRFGDNCLWYVPSASVRHFVPRSRLTLRYVISRCWLEGTTKADVTAAFGPAAMAHDRRYLISVLPAAIAGYVVDAVRWRDPSGLANALLLLGGTAVTAAGYSVKTLAHALARVRSG